jgi:hypothetical protein
MFSSNTTQVAADGAYQISRSLRFNAADNAYLNRTPASSSSKTTWTFSTWFKRSSLDNFQTILSAGQPVSSVYLVALFFANNNLDLAVYGSGGAQEGRLTSTAVYRDVSAWYHVMAVLDTTNATSSNRMKLYINGVQITVFSTESYPAQNSIYAVNSTDPHIMGAYSYGTTLNKIDGYQTETYLIDGQALTPSSFGETNAQTGVWQPKAYSGSYGTNGFYLNFSDNSNTTAATLGKDYSGNGNNWTPNNFSVTAGAGNDSLVDSPTSFGTDTGVGGTVRGNYGTWNPLTFSSTAKIPTLTNGNLDASVPAGAGLPVALGTFVMPSGQWYWEVTITSGGAQMVGIADSTAGGANSNYTTANAWYYYSGGQSYTNNTPVTYGTTFTVGDVIGVALDIGAGTLVFYKNGVSQGTAFNTGLTGKTFVAALGNASGGAAQGYTGNFGQRAFSNTAPSGFKALCTQNLPTPTIGATSTTLAEDYFGVNLWTGNSSTQAITNGGFQPDWVWIKGRSTAYNHQLFDAVRGTNKAIYSNLTNAEFTDTDGLTAFNSNGFTMGAEAGINNSGDTYVGWQWKANGAGSTNTAGTITSTVSASTTSGFSIVTYTGNATDNATIGHGLGVAPALLIGKSRNAVGAWPCWVTATGFGANDFLALNSTDGKGTAVTLWGGSNGSVPTSTVFKVGNNTSINGSGTTYVVYCFAPVAGFSAFGSYLGNASTDGPFIYTGFRPAFVLIKRCDTTSGGYWRILDDARNTSNVLDKELYPNAPDSEGTFTALDFVSNGVKIRNSDSQFNGNAATYFYACFAENPFKYSIAR